MCSSRRSKAVGPESGRRNDRCDYIDSKYIQYATGEEIPVHKATKGNPNIEFQETAKFAAVSSLLRDPGRKYRVQTRQHQTDKRNPSPNEPNNRVLALEAELADGVRTRRFQAIAACRVATGPTASSDHTI